DIRGRRNLTDRGRAAMPPRLRLLEERIAPKSRKAAASNELSRALLYGDLQAFLLSLRLRVDHIQHERHCPAAAPVQDWMAWGRFRCDRRLSGSSTLRCLRLRRCCSSSPSRRPGRSRAALSLSAIFTATIRPGSTLRATP